MRPEKSGFNHRFALCTAIGFLLLVTTLGCTPHEPAGHATEENTGKPTVDTETKKLDPFKENMSCQSRIGSTSCTGIKTLACGKVYLKNQSDSPLMVKVGKKLLEKLRALPWTKEVTLIPRGQKPKLGEAAPNLFFFIDEKDIEKSKASGTNSTNFSGTFTLMGGTDSLIRKLRSYGYHLSPIGTRLSFELKANLDCQHEGPITEADLYDRVAEAAATHLTKSIDDEIKIELGSIVPFPDLPKDFYPAYQEPPTLPECIAELKPRLLLSDCGYMLPCRTYWTFKSNKPPGELLESIAQAMESTAWDVPKRPKDSQRYNLRMKHKEDILEVFMDYDDEMAERERGYSEKHSPKSPLSKKDQKKVMKIVKGAFDQGALQGDKVVLSETEQEKILAIARHAQQNKPDESDSDEQPPEVTYYVEYRNQMIQAEFTKAIESVLKPETPVETLLLLRSNMRSKQKAKLLTLLENSHSSHLEALLEIANHGNSSNKEKVKEKLHRLWVTKFIANQYDADIEKKVQEIAKKLGVESKYKNKQHFEKDDIPILESIGFRRLPFETVPERLPISPNQPVGFFGLDKDDEVFTVHFQMVQTPNQSNRYLLKHSKIKSYMRSHSSPFIGPAILKDPISGKSYTLELKEPDVSSKDGGPEYYLEITTQ